MMAESAWVRRLWQPVRTPDRAEYPRKRHYVQIGADASAILSYWLIVLNKLKLDRLQFA